MKTFFYIIILTVVLSACGTSQIYETNQNGNIENLIMSDTALHYPIQADDKITVSVWDNDNLILGSVFNIYNANESYGKWILVAADGRVMLPKIGHVKLAGLSCPEAADLLIEKYAEFLVNPIVIVKVLNKEISILGDVVNPGVYGLDKEVLTLTEAIAKAKGLDKYANPKKIQIIRNDSNYFVNLAELNGTKAYRLVLAPNDIIYIPAKRIKTVAQNSPTLLPFASILTSIAVFASLLN